MSANPQVASPTGTPRRATSADAAAIAALEAVFPGDRLSLRSIRRLIRSPSAVVLVCDGAGGLDAALVLLTRRGSHSARIYSLAVHPAARGLGLGRQLITEAESQARAHGCRRVRLEVRGDNAPAQRLYAQLGYSDVARIPAYYEDGAEALRLQRLL